MTSTTIRASRRAVVTSWLAGLVVLGGLALLLGFQPRSEPVAGVRPGREKTAGALERRNRALPTDYSARLVEQSEVLIKRELRQRLRRFEEMDRQIRDRKDQLLGRIEGRTLPAQAPSDANHTSLARVGFSPDGSSPGPDASVQALYEQLARLESEIQRAHSAAKAAEWALRRGQSFPEVLQSMQPGTTRMPDFETLIHHQRPEQAWPRSPLSLASAGLVILSVADLNDYRGVLGQASRESGLAESRLDSLLGNPNPSGRPPPSMAGPASGFGPNGEGGLAATRLGAPTEPFARYEAKLDEAMIKAQALPGRRFSRESARHGWLYVNTWYMIGPWDNFGRGDFVIPHPPEIAVDFDALYTDGMRGIGIEETESHPLRMEGRRVILDGVLRWKFMQSESMHNTVPVTIDRSTYYAYTELHFDEPVTMLVAIGTDDSGKVWINGREIWRDLGTSWYHIDEHIELFQFQQGWNRILVRLENGGGSVAGFSFLICPKEAAFTVKP